MKTRTYVDIKNDIKWNENFILLRKFIMEFNRFPLYNEIYNGYRIGNWCNRQRQAYKCNKGVLTKEKIDLLESIGFIWDSNEELWMNTFELLKEFIEEFGRFPFKNESYKEINIGAWCNLQRQVYKGNRGEKLTQKRIDLLNSIGFIWEVSKERWMNNFELLKEFKEEFGRFPKNKEIYKGANIGKWCDRQRQSYKGNGKGIITEEEINLLESIGFQWKIIN